MEESRFDNLARSVASPSRRTLLRRLAGVALASPLFPALGDAAARDRAATCRKKSSKAKKKCLKKARKHSSSHASPTDPCAGGTCVDREPESCAAKGTCPHGSACRADSDCQSNLCGGGVCCDGPCAANNAGARCQPETGRCFLTCNEGWGNCDGDGRPESGCETSLIDNPRFCGDCNNDCTALCGAGETGICQGDTCSCQ